MGLNMPVQVSWYDRSFILLAEYVGHLTVDEINTAREEIITRLNRNNRKAHLIADWSRADKMPIRYSMRPRVLDLLNHRNMGFCVLVGANSVITFWAELYTRTGNIHYLTAATLEEAVEALHIVMHTA
jgi:hypothetical protein